MIDCPIDNVVLLLSTDWFMGYWHLIGLEASENVRKNVQAECRQIVSQIMGGASGLYERSYEERRQLETVRLLREALNKSNVGDTFSARMEDILYGPVANDKDKKAAGFLGWRTEDIQRGKYTAAECWLSPELTRKISENWLATTVNVPGFEALNLASTSKWDVYIRSLTPDLPTMLSDFVSAAIIRPWHFVMFWTSIDLTGDERSELRGWYKYIANKAKIHDFRLPSWID